jgi:hypothetical protein
MSASKFAPPVKVNDWNPEAIKFLPPRPNKAGGMGISIMSNQTNRVLAISTPMLRTFGVDDYKDAEGVHNNKYTIGLSFPNETEARPETDLLLKNLETFEKMMIDKAIDESIKWWPKEKKKLSRDVVMDRFKPFVKWSKDKDSGEIDTSKPPVIRPKVNYYDPEGWESSIYDTSSRLLFPSEDKSDCRTPIDWIPSGSNVACVIQCGGVWVSPLGWGITWKMTQCVVKPRDVQSVYGCQIELSDSERACIDEVELIVSEAPVVPAYVKPAAVAAPTIDLTSVPDSDDEAEPAKSSVAEPEEPAPEKEDPPKPAKVVIKKALVLALPVEVAEASPAESEAPPKPTKVVIKKTPVPAESDVSVDAPKKKKIVKVSPVV